jgi:hypothetical protein
MGPPSRSTASEPRTPPPRQAHCRLLLPVAPRRPSRLLPPVPATNPCRAGPAAPAPAAPTPTADPRRARLALARRAAGRRPPLLPAPLPEARGRRDGDAQAQHASLAPDGRPGRGRGSPRGADRRHQGHAQRRDHSRHGPCLVVRADQADRRLQQRPGRPNAEPSTTPPHLVLHRRQGWRIEVKGWPRLSEVGAWRGEAPLRAGGFYTQDEVRRGRAAAVGAAEHGSMAAWFYTQDEARHGRAAAMGAAEHGSRGWPHGCRRRWRAQGREVTRGRDSPQPRPPRPSSPPPRPPLGS